MKKTGLPEHLKNVRGLFYSRTTENISGQMALAAGFASVEELKSYQTKSRSKNRPENKYWFKAALDLRNRLGLNHQLSIEDFNKVVDLYPTKKNCHLFIRNQPAILQRSSIGSIGI